MDEYSVSQRDGKLHIEGFPDAVKLIKLDGPKAQRIADLLLHRHDLEFAGACLDGINLVTAAPEFLREALWRSAIVHFAKCFGNSAARFQLSREKIYRNEPPEAKQVFDYFQHLRDKHIVHDENAYAQSIPSAVLNGGNKAYKIEKILCLGTHGNTLEQANYSNLKLLIGTALEWVSSEFETCCQVVTKELEAIPYTELLNRPNVAYRVPEVGEISGNRRHKP